LEEQTRENPKCCKWSLTGDSSVGLEDENSDKNTNNKTDTYKNSNRNKYSIGN
jgi:hypothetical protein